MQRFGAYLMIAIFCCRILTANCSIATLVGGKIGKNVKKLPVGSIPPGKNQNNSKTVVAYQPRHVHLSYGDDAATEMFITWSTLDDTNGTFVEYGINQFNERSINGSSTLFLDFGAFKKKQYIHRVHLKNLSSNQQYLYHCGSDKGWSETFSFKTMRNGTEWSPHLAIYGDLGVENGMSLKRLQREVQLGVYDAILHVGDIAYDMETNNGLVGDAFLERIQPIAAYLPYMTCPGNHEFGQNFSHYKNRFTMPGKFKSMFYSFNMGPIHFISFSTEFYHFTQYGMDPLSNQYQWIENDLKEATKPENRGQRPWIVTYGHRPMYCSNQDFDCATKATLVRVGVPYLHPPRRRFGLEDLFMKYGVDLCIWAHEHSYERMFPLYNYNVCNGSLLDPYKNPRCLVHVTTGSAGSKEEHDPFLPSIPRWSAFHATDYGYSRLKVFNNTHLYMEQVSEEKVHAQNY